MFFYLKVLTFGSNTEKRERELEAVWVGGRCSLLFLFIKMSLGTLGTTWYDTGEQVQDMCSCLCSGKGGGEREPAVKMHLMKMRKPRRLTFLPVNSACIVSF